MSILFAALLLASGPTGAPPVTNVAATPQASIPAAKPRKEKKVCRADPTETGSHMVKRVCRTQEQWDAQRGRSVDEMGTIPTTR